jgi:hypothetical protein
MVRDSDEWRRPWAEGDVALPAVRASEGPATLYAAGLDGAFDVVDDSMAALVSPSMAALRTDRSPTSAGPQPALAAAAAAPVGRTAHGRDHRAAGTRGRGLLTGVLGGAAGAMLVILGLGAFGIVDVDLDRIGSQAATIPVAPAPGPGAAARRCRTRAPERPSSLTSPTGSFRRSCASTSAGAST